MGFSISDIACLINNKIPFVYNIKRKKIFTINYKMHSSLREVEMWRGNIGFSEM